MVARGDFSILLASLYGAGEISAMVALLVIIMSVVGSLTSKYSYKIRKMVVSAVT